MSNYQFTNTWFLGAAKNFWDQLMPQLKPKKLLEIGSYEGASACYLIDNLASASAIELHCLDTWEGGVEHQKGGTAEVNMGSVEARFKHNTAQAIANASHPVELVVHKGYSEVGLVELLAAGQKGSFDFIYVDGSHQAPDVLSDAVLAFKLLRVGGIMAFDDYLWSENLPSDMDPIRCPKPAVDAFTNLYCRKLRVLSAPLYQLYVQKIAD